MSRFEDHRMPFEPADDDYRGFDLSDEEETARGPLILALALGVLIVFGAVVWNTYRHGVRSPGDVPIIRADAGPYKTEPEDAGGTPIEGLGETLFREFEPPTGDDALAGSGYRVTDTGASVSGDETLQGGPAIDLTEGLGSSSDGETRLRPSIDQLRSLAELADDVLDDLSDAGAPTSPPASAPEQVTAVATEPPPAAPTPPATRTEPTPTAIASPPETRTIAGLTSDGAFLVQLAAFRSREAADTGWTDMQSKFGTTLTGTEKRVQRADLGARGVFYRLQVGAFDTRDNASTFCNHLKSRGGDCIVVGG